MNANNRTFIECHSDEKGTVYHREYNDRRIIWLDWRIPVWPGRKFGIKASGDYTYRYVLMRGPMCVCAYIGIPKGHPLARIRNYDWFPLNVHGGLTFCADGAELAAGPHCEGGWGDMADPRYVWYGYDHAHCFDRSFCDLDIESGKFGFKRSPELTAMKQMSREWTPAAILGDNGWRAELDELLEWSWLKVDWHLTKLRHESRMDRLRSLKWKVPRWLKEQRESFAIWRDLLDVRVKVWVLGRIVRTAIAYAKCRDKLSTRLVASKTYQAICSALRNL